MSVLLLCLGVCCSITLTSTKPLLYEQAGDYVHTPHHAVHHTLSGDHPLRDGAGYPGPFVRFLIAVNATQGPCVASAVTPTLQPRVRYNESQAVSVGSCDKGPLLFDMQFPSKPGENISLNLTFHSSVIEDASPPSCQITWDGHYLTPPPPPMVSVSDTQTLPSLLPGCFTMDSREGNFMTYYWFYLLEWGF